MGAIPLISNDAKQQCVTPDSPAIKGLPDDSLLLEAVLQQYPLTGYVIGMGLSLNPDDLAKHEIVVNNHLHSFSAIAARAFDIQERFF